MGVGLRGLVALRFEKETAGAVRRNQAQGRIWRDILM